jgi:hypothetical protein
MARLESIVRPFQTTDFSPGRTTPQGAVPVAETLLVEIGKVGQVTTFQGSFSLTTTVYMDQKAKEISRETSVKRVTNPDDETQFVDVERIDKLVTTFGSGKDYQKTESTFNNKDSTS